MIYIIFSHPE